MEGPILLSRQQEEVSRLCCPLGGFARDDGIAVKCARSAEGESEGLGAGVEELDLERPVLDRPLLANELIEPLAGDGAYAIGVDVGAAVVASPPTYDRTNRITVLQAARGVKVIATPFMQ